MFLLNNPGFNLLENSLNASALRQKVISNNIANVDTPLFKRSDVQFEELLRKQMDNQQTLTGIRTDSRHFNIGNASAPVTAKVVEDRNTALNNNLNNVDVDYEMSLMAKNQLTYNTIIQQVGGEIKHLRTAIGGVR